MNEFEKMHKGVIRWTIILAIPVSIIAAIIFHDIWLKTFIGIWLGTLIGIIGFQFIVNMANQIDANSSEGYGKKRGVFNFSLRFLFYLVTFVGCVYIGFPILAILVGLLMNKPAILIYTLIEKEGKDGGSN